MRIFFSVGEPSGDLHGANLIADLRRSRPDLEAVGFGGPRMQAAGCQLLFDLTRLAVMGVWQVVQNVRRFFRLLDEADRYFAEHRPDAVVLIDYPGFNWWIARRARRHGIPVFYYGVPQMWAWAGWRVGKLKRLVDHALCKLPFEQAWFRQRGCPATYVGHPYFDELVRYRPDQTFIDQHRRSGQRLLVLLPGSRTQEVRRNLPDLLEAARGVQQQHSDVAVTVACYSPKHADYVRQTAGSAWRNLAVEAGRTPELIGMADACVACSGSVSLELLYHRKPAVIVYRIGRGTAVLSRWLLKAPFITLVNLLAAGSVGERDAVRYDPDDRNRSDVPMPEYLTCRPCGARVASWLNAWFSEPRLLQQRTAQLDAIATGFAEPGASVRAARFVLQQLDEKGTPSGSPKPAARRAA